MEWEPQLLSLFAWPWALSNNRSPLQGSIALRRHTHHDRGSRQLGVGVGCCRGGQLCCRPPAHSRSGSQQPPRPNSRTFCRAGSCPRAPRCSPPPSWDSHSLAETEREKVAERESSGTVTGQQMRPEQQRAACSSSLTNVAARGVDTHVAPLGVAAGLDDVHGAAAQPAEPAGSLLLRHRLCCAAAAAAARRGARLLAAGARRVGARRRCCSCERAATAWPLAAEQ